MVDQESLAHPPASYDFAWRLRQDLRRAGLNLDKILQVALEFLAREVDVEQAGIFLADRSGDILREAMRLERGGLIAEGYRQEHIREGNIFYSLLKGGREIVSSPMENGEYTHHVLVSLEMPGEGSSHLLPSSSLRPLSAGRHSQQFGNKGVAEFIVPANADLEIFSIWCREVSQWIALGFMERKLERQSQQIKAFGELSWLFVTSLRLEDRLRLIIEGIQKLFGFDRIRLYLLNTEGSQLVGDFETNIRREMVKIEHERYPVNPGEHRSLVEILWNSLRLNSWSRILEYSLAHHDKMLYLPLKIQSKEIGVLVVDNLISQEPISEEVRNLLQSFAGQLSLAVDNSRLFSEVEKLSLFDALSHLPNRRYFDQRLQEEYYRSNRGNLAFAICMIDLDFFKEINDTYGHQMGDQAIAQLGVAIKNMLRQSDFAARWGGDELAILLGNTNEQEAPIVIERILNAIRAVHLVYPSDPPKEVKLTASIGVAVFPQDGKTVEELMVSADRALYEVKFKGRDGFLLASHIPNLPGF